MPDTPHGKVRPHPFRDGPGRAVPAPDADAAGRSGVRYAELGVTTNYTFLTGASHPEEFVIRAAQLGYHALGVADVNTLAGVVRAHVAAKEAGVRLVVGSRIVLRQTEPGAEPVSMWLYPCSRDGYARLCRLLTLGKRRAPKGECDLSLHDVLEHARGLLCVLAPSRDLDERFVQTTLALRHVFDDDRMSIAAWRGLAQDDERRLQRIEALCLHTNLPMLAINHAHHHVPERRALQDVLTCVRLGCTIEQAGRRLHPNAERHLKSPAEMARLFEHHPDAIARTIEVADRAGAFGMDQLRYEYPSETCPPGRTPAEHLRALSMEGARARYPEGVPPKVLDALEYELALIAELKYEAYFLTCHEIVRFARSRGILCQGRGGAANSAVCYVLGITEVDPARFNLLFERFISRARNEPPDIDIDFEHERREEVIQHIYARYGRERAALTAEVISYRGRSAIRDVGKAMGLSPDTVDLLARHTDLWGQDVSDTRVREAGLNPHEPTIARLIALSRELLGFPRHLSQHVGGFVITSSPLCDLVPIENAAMEDRTVIEWDKDDIDAMGMLKVDVLGLGMLTAVRKAIGMVNSHAGTEARRHADASGGVLAPDAVPHSSASASASPASCLAYAHIARDPTDSAVYDMICSADTVGVFQIESRAQMSMLPRLRPRTFYDLVIEVAIVRPGPIQGKMVHPYLRRRNGEEQAWYPSADVERVLGRTLGVPLFQEQAMQLAIVAAGFSPDEADKLRRAMAAWKRKGDLIFRFGQRLIEGMIARGYDAEFAHRCFEQIKGFSEYGFPESHAASFAILVYVSAWLKRYHPAAFAGALINSQPMGFYAPAQLIRDAREHGVEVRTVDVNFSAWECHLEQGMGPGTPERDRHATQEPEHADDRSADHAAAAGSPCAPARLGAHAPPALRLGLLLVKGLARSDAQRVAEAVRTHGPFTGIERLWRASGVSTGALRALARADAFGSMGLSRQEALWAVSRLKDEELPLFDAPDDDAERDGVERLPMIAPATRVLHDYASVGLSLKSHPVWFVREELSLRGAIACGDLRDPMRTPTGARVTVAGLVLVRQRPSTASGVVFMTLEDETGIANIIIWPRTFEKHRSVARLSSLLLVRGKVERSGEVVHVHADGFESLDDRLPALGSMSRDFH